MKELGYKQVQIWLDPAEVALCEKAAAANGRVLSRWIVWVLVEAARRHLQGAGE